MSDIKFLLWKLYVREVALGKSCKEIIVTGQIINDDKVVICSPSQDSKFIVSLHSAPLHLCVRTISRSIFYGLQAVLTLQQEQPGLMHFFHCLSQPWGCSSLAQLLSANGVAYYNNGKELSLWIGVISVCGAHCTIYCIKPGSKQDFLILPFICRKQRKAKQFLQMATWN